MFRSNLTYNIKIHDDVQNDFISEFMKGDDYIKGITYISIVLHRLCLSLHDSLLCFHDLPDLIHCLLVFP